MSESLAHVDGRELRELLSRLASNEREVMVELLLHLAEFDRRGAYLPLGFPSLFEYLREELGYSNGAAFRRMVSCRLLRRFPRAAEMLRDGRLCLTTVTTLRDVLTDENADELLAKAAGLTREQVEALVAVYHPKKPPRDAVRPVPAPRLVTLPVAALPAAGPDAVREPEPAAATPPPLTRPDVVVAVPRLPPKSVEVVTEDLRLLKVTVTREFLDRLEDVKMALSHRFPEGRFEDVVGACFEVFLEQYARRRGIATAGQPPARVAGSAEAGGVPRRLLKRSRHIPVPVLRAAWARDGGCCSFRGPDGHVCGSRYRLEFDHVQPSALGGEPTEENIAVRCRRHNQWRARQTFGAAAIARAQAARRQSRVQFASELTVGVHRSERSSASASSTEPAGRESARAPPEPGGAPDG